MGFNCTRNLRNKHMVKPCEKQHVQGQQRALFRNEMPTHSELVTLIKHQSDTGGPKRMQLYKYCKQQGGAKGMQLYKGQHKTSTRCDPLGQSSGRTRSTFKVNTGLQRVKTSATRCQRCRPQRRSRKLEQCPGRRRPQRVSSTMRCWRTAVQSLQ